MGRNVFTRRQDPAEWWGAARRLETFCHETMTETRGGLECKESQSLPLCPLGGGASCGCSSYLCWMLSSGMWRGSRGCSDGDSSSSAGDMNHSSAWSLFSFSLSHVSSPSTTGLPPRPHTAPQTGSRSLGSSGLKSPWPPASSLRCSSEIADKHRKDVTLFTVYVVRRIAI